MKTFIFFILSVFFSFVANAVEPLTLPIAQQINVSKNIEYFKEQGDDISLETAIPLFPQIGKNTDHSVLNFGINSSPIWLHLKVNNTTQQAFTSQLIIENSWLDLIDVYFIQDDQTIKVSAGDAKPYSDREVLHRFFLFEHAFETGETDIYVRIETVDVMLLPIYFNTPEGTHVLENNRSIYYGFVYGFLLALMAYNLALFFSLKDKRYLFYVLYLFSFLAMNMAYTGHGFEWLWSEFVLWQAKAIMILMMLYCYCGLLFAQTFLDTEKNLPLVHQILKLFILISGASFVISLLLNSQVGMLYIAFIVMSLFPFVMLLMGFLSWQRGVKEAKYFLPATLIAMLSAVMVTMAVLGFLPYTLLTYHGIEAGILLETILFALALADQFRENLKEKVQAEYFAFYDLLTNIFNRRGFYKVADRAFSIAARKKRYFTIILFDIDHFKRFNDHYGHVQGDDILTKVGKVLLATARKGDIYARWGGEEFILALPETTLAEGIILAERLRASIEKILLTHQGEALYVTASFGVACTNADFYGQEGRNDYDQLIAQADKQLYCAKAEGRNRVCG